MRTRIVAALAAGFLVIGCTTAGAVATSAPVECTITDNTLSCPLPAPPAPVTVTETATVTADPVTVTVTAAPSSSAAPTTSAAPVTTSAPATTAPTTTAAATSSAAPTTTTTTPPASAWPDASNTGVPAGITLVKSSQCSITVDGTTIDGKELNCPGGVGISAKNVTIKNSKVIGHIYMDNDRSPNYSLTVSDSEVDGGDYTWPTIATGNTKVYRSNLHGGQNGLTCDDGSAFCEMYDSWVHGQNQVQGVDTHLGGFLSLGAKATCTGTDGKCVILKHNSIVCDAPVNNVGGGCTGGINLIPHFSKLHDVLIEGNRIGANTGQSFCTYGGELPGQQATNIVYRNNVFEHGANGICGAYGPVTGFASNTGNVWAGNVYDDGSVVNPAN